MPEAALFDGLSGGDERALREVCRRYGPRVAAIAHRRLGPRLRAHVETADIVQTSLLEVARSSGRVRFDSERAFLVWVRRVVERKILRAARHWAAGRRDPVRETNLGALGPDDIEDPWSEHPGQILERKEALDSISVAVASLPRRDRDVVIQRLLLRLPWQAVAGVLGTSVDAAQMRFVRARRRLARALRSLA
jgi:RNA polymerase sigma-70 factor (ECF subfamily)